MDITPHYDNTYLAELTGFQLSKPERLPDNNTQEPGSASRRWTSNPVVHLLVVGSGVGLVCLCLMQMTDSLTLTQKTAPDPLLTAEEENTLTPIRDDSGDIKTGLAFGNQSDDIAALADLPVESTTPDKTPATPSAPSPVRTVPARATMQPVSVSSPPLLAAPLPVAATAATPPVAMPITGQPATPALLAPTTENAQSPDEETDGPTNDNTDPAHVVEIENQQTLTVLSGETATAQVETPFAAGVPLKGQLRLTAPLKTPGGDSALAADALLIAEAVASADGNNAYFRITSAIVNGEEVPLLPDAVVAFRTDGLLHNDSARSRDRSGGIDLEQILLTGGLAALDIDDDSLLGGIALDILGQLEEQETLRLEAALQAEEVWEIPAGTELIVRVNETLTLPVPENSAPLPSAPAPVLSSFEPSTLVASDDIPHSLIGFGSLPSSEVTVVLHRETGKPISFLRRNETISEVFLDDPTMVTLDYDKPLESGEAALIYAVLTDESEVDATTLDVVTETAAGNRRWHRFTLQRG